MFAQRIHVLGTTVAFCALVILACEKDQTSPANKDEFPEDELPAGTEEASDDDTQKTITKLKRQYCNGEDRVRLVGSAYSTESVAAATCRTLFGAELSEWPRPVKPNKVSAGTCRINKGTPKEYWIFEYSLAGGKVNHMKYKAKCERMKGDFDPYFYYATLHCIPIDNPQNGCYLYLYDQDKGRPSCKSVIGKDAKKAKGCGLSAHTGSCFIRHEGNPRPGLSIVYYQSPPDDLSMQKSDCESLGGEFQPAR